MKKVLITGGAGYLGSVLSEVLLNKGYKVTVIDNLSYKQTSVAPFVYNNNFKFVLGDVRDISILKPLVDTHDVIIPLAKILVLVPTKVQQPPKMEAYETGISNLEEETPSCLDRAKITGSKTTTTGVLFTKAEISATRPSKISMNLL